MKKKKKARLSGLEVGLGRLDDEGLRRVHLLANDPRPAFWFIVYRFISNSELLIALFENDLLLTIYQLSGSFRNTSCF